VQAPRRSLESAVSKFAYLLERDPVCFRALTGMARSKRDLARLPSTSVVQRTALLGCVLSYACLCMFVCVCVSFFFFFLQCFSVCSFARIFHSSCCCCAVPVSVSVSVFFFALFLAKLYVGMSVVCSSLVYPSPPHTLTPTPTLTLTLGFAVCLFLCMGDGV
jgi:hypothetical protein